MYRSTQSPGVAKRSAPSNCWIRFSNGSATDAVAAILHASAATLTDDEIARLEGIIKEARQKGK